ncbi:MAG: cation:proton antiporter [Polyangiaceae bacterium]|nr:cation:proton antiporter [Polyangiaceae bacterium]
MVRAVIVLALVVGLSFAARSFLVDSTAITGSGAALALGFLLLSALQTGRIFHALHLPHLTGFLLCGAVFGPEVIGLITPAMLQDLALVKKVAVGLIALTAGCELNFAKLRPQIKSIGLISLAGLFFAVLCLFPFFFLISGHLEFMRGMTVEQRVVVSLICSNVLAALSPAVVMGILSETRASGPLSELCLSIVVLADLLIAVTFSFSDSVAHAVFPVEGAGGSVFGALAVHILGSIVAGIAVGTIFALYIRRVALRVGLFVFAVCFVVAEAGTALHLDPLLVGLSAGLFLENVSPVSGHEVIHQTETAAMPTFAVFFAVVGAEVHVHAFLAVAPFAVGAAVARAVGIYAGARVGARLAGVPRHIAQRVPFGMLPQAGIALGLAGLVKSSFPGWGEGAATLLLGTIVVNEMLGPVLFRMALERAGEIGRNMEPGASLEPAHAPEPDSGPRGRPVAAKVRVSGG